MNQSTRQNESVLGQQAAVVVCEPNEPPSVRALSPSPHASLFLEEVRQMVGGHIEVLPYPRQLGRRGLVVAVNEIGTPRGLDQNRWGLVGTFVVFRQRANADHPRGLSPEEAGAVARELDQSYGYLDPAAGVRTASSNGIGFHAPRAKRAEVFEQQGGKWSPQLHFTGAVERREAVFMNWLLQRYSRGVVAHHFDQPFPGTYSVELQFGDSPEDRRLMQECRRHYLDAFDENGALKKERAECPPLVTLQSLKSPAGAD